MRYQEYHLHYKILHIHLQPILNDTLIQKRILPKYKLPYTKRDSTFKRLTLLHPQQNVFPIIYHPAPPPPLSPPPKESACATGSQLGRGSFEVTRPPTVR